MLYFRVSILRYQLGREKRLLLELFEYIIHSQDSARKTLDCLMIIDIPLRKISETVIF
jgi:hypothetical protein